MECNNNFYWVNNVANLKVYKTVKTSVSYFIFQKNHFSIMLLIQDAIFRLVVVY